MQKTCPFVCQLSLFGLFFLITSASLVKAQTSITNSQPISTNNNGLVETNYSTDDMAMTGGPNSSSAMGMADETMMTAEATGSASATQSAFVQTEEMMTMTTFEEFEKEWQAEKKTLMSQINTLKTQTEVVPTLAWYQEANVVFALMAVSGIFLLISIILFIQNNSLKKGGGNVLKSGAATLFDKKVGEAQNALTGNGVMKAPESTLKMGSGEPQKSTLPSEMAPSLGGISFPDKPTIGTPLPTSALGGVMPPQKPSAMDLGGGLAQKVGLSSAVGSPVVGGMTSGISPKGPETTIAPLAGMSGGTPPAVGAEGAAPSRPIMMNQTVNPIAPMAKPVMSEDKIGEVAKKPVMVENNEGKSAVASMLGGVDKMSNPDKSAIPTSVASMVSAGGMSDDPAQPIVSELRGVPSKSTSEVASPKI